MRTKILWETPKESINGNSRISVNYFEGKLILRLKYVTVNEEHYCDLIFEDVVCFRHMGGYFAKNSELEAYEKLIEIYDSEWRNDLKTRNPEEFKLRDLRHFSIYTQDDRLFDIVAERFSIINK